jgi:hypothetical protein
MSKWSDGKVRVKESNARFYRILLFSFKSALTVPFYWIFFSRDEVSSMPIHELVQEKAKNHKEQALRYAKDEKVWGINLTTGKCRRIQV